VLVVEDEPDFLETYTRLLELRGLRAITAGTRQEGVRLIQREAVALVIVDLRLPDGDGLDVVRIARSAPMPLPAIVITGLNSEASRSAALAAGAVACLAKPFTAAAFGAAVERALGAH